MESDDLFRLLKPVLGDRIDSLWLDYQLNPDSRRDVEGVLRALAKHHLGRHYETSKVLMVPPPPEQAVGEYPLGSVIYPGVSPAPFGLREKEWIQHVGVFGRTGSGKTNVGFLIVRRLLEHDRPFLIFDWKRNYRDLLVLPWGRSIDLITVGREVRPFYFNPLIPPEGTLTTVWLKKLIEILCHVYFLGEGVAYLLQKAIDAVYRDFGSHEGSGRWPTLEDVRRWLEAYPARGREAQWMDSTVRVVGTLCYGRTGEVLNSGRNTPLEVLLLRNTILELDALSNTDKTFLIESLMLWVHHYRLQQPERETFKHAILIEEAHHVLLRRQGSSETVMDVILREIRELGEALVIIDQHPSLISIPALGNTYCTIAMNLKHGRDIASIGQALVLSEEEREYLGQLPVGQGIVKLQDRWPRPFLVEFPLIGVQKGAVQDSAMKAEGVSADSARIPPPEAQGTDIPPARAPDKRVEDQDRIRSEEMVLVMDVVCHPCSGVASRYRRLGLSVSRGSRLLSSLLSSSLLSSHLVTTPSGRVRYVRLEEKARQVLKRGGVTLPPARGNEGPEHEYWKHRAAEHFRRQGHRVELEKALPSGHRVDVFATGGHRDLAVEIERSPDQAVANLERCLEGTTGDVVVIAARPGLRGEIESRIRLRSDTRRVEIWDLRDLGGVRQRTECSLSAGGNARRALRTHHA